jgi:hypothetical protein
MEVDLPAVFGRLSDGSKARKLLGLAFLSARRPSSSLLMTRPRTPRRSGARAHPGPVREGAAWRRLRHEAGVTPVSFLKARQNAASDS